MTEFASLLERARRWGLTDERHVIGICGPPGSGKTTLAEALVAQLADEPPEGADRSWVAHVPMDGFHLADVELERLGRLGAKGAEDTFDAHGYAAILERVRSPRSGETVYAPGFERHLEQPLAGAIPVLPTCRLVVTEGNYLLHDGDGWQRARRSVDDVWFCDIEPDVRRSRLVERHIRFGKTPAEASAWVEKVDEVNAREILATAERADLLVPALAMPTVRSAG